MLHDLHGSLFLNGIKKLLGKFQRKIKCISIFKNVYINSQKVFVYIERILNYK